MTTNLTKDEVVDISHALDDLAESHEDRADQRADMRDEDGAAGWRVDAARLRALAERIINAASITVEDGAS